jgi:hypothetical protein
MLGTSGRFADCGRKCRRIAACNTVYSELLFDLLTTCAEVPDGLVFNSGDFENSVLADAVDREANFLQLMRQRGMIRGAGRHLEIADDLGMQTANSVIAWTNRNVHANAVRVQIRIAKYPTVNVLG